MLHSFERLRHPADRHALIAAADGQAVLAHSGDYVQPWHWHDCVMFMLPSRGTLELQHEDQRRGTWLSHDRFAVVPAHRAHRTRTGLGASSHVALYATGDLLRQLDARIGSLAEFHRRTRATVLGRRTPEMRELQQFALDERAYGQAEIQRALATALLVQCIAQVLAGEAPPDPSPQERGRALVADLQAYLTLHADQVLPLDALGERFGVSRRHLTRLFRDATGMTVGVFQQRMRLQMARQLLAETALPVAEIAYRVGYDSGAALTHAMQRVHGRSPSAVRDADEPVTPGAKSPRTAPG